MTHRDLRAKLTIADRVGICLGSLSLMAGVLLLAAGESLTVEIAGTGLLGLAGVLFVALAFLMVGESERVRALSYHLARSRSVVYAIVKPGYDAVVYTRF